MDDTDKKINDLRQQLIDLNWLFKNHTHDATNSFRINPIDLFVFTQEVSNATITPTDSPMNGTVRLLFDSTHWYVWFRVNKLWKYIALT
jgi:hypothetical protein